MKFLTAALAEYIDRDPNGRFSLLGLLTQLESKSFPVKETISLTAYVILAPEEVPEKMGFRVIVHQKDTADYYEVSSELYSYPSANRVTSEGRETMLLFEVENYEFETPGAYGFHLARGNERLVDVFLPVLRIEPDIINECLAIVNGIDESEVGGI